MKKPGLKERFGYWFDRRMSKGTGSMIIMLSAVTAVIILLIAALISFLGLQEEGGFGLALWDSLATVINAWMPYSGDGSTGYILLTAVVAIVGLLFTSVLIGIVGTAIEEKLTALRKGNSRVLEQGHIVILGFQPGEYTLLNQIMTAQSETGGTIVIAESMEKDEMEDLIRENLEIPKGVRLICRHADICDPQSLECCSIPAARSVVIFPYDDGKTVKSILAVDKLLQGAERRPGITAAVSDNSYLLPMQSMEGLFMLQTYDAVSRIIAHTCTQPGLSGVFSDVFDFGGNEFYHSIVPEASGMTFGEISMTARGGVPVGIMGKEGIRMAPSADTVVRTDDELLYFAEFCGKLRLVRNAAKTDLPELYSGSGCVKDPHVVIIGINNVLPVVLRELQGKCRRITVATSSRAAQAAETVRNYPSFDIDIFTDNIMDPAAMERLVSGCSHVIMLSHHNMDAEESDLISIRLLLQLRELKARRGFGFNITAEMRLESNRSLITRDDPTDFIVASDMSSMILAQLTVNQELYPVLRQMVSNDGSDLFQVSADEFGCAGKEIPVPDLRMLALKRGEVFLGYLSEADGAHPVLNPSEDTAVCLEKNDQLILIGDKWT